MGLHVVVVSALTLQELELAPKNVRSLFHEVPSEIIPISEEAFQLGSKYIEEGAITEKYFSDAVHIVLASLNQIDTIISWNFKYMVNVNRIRHI